MAARLEKIVDRIQANVEFDPLQTATKVKTGVTVENGMEDITFVVKQFKANDDGQYVVTFNRLQGTALLYRSIAEKFLEANELLEVMDADYVLDSLKDVKVDDEQVDEEDEEEYGKLNHASVSNDDDEEKEEV
jgi:hypothetical protein